MNENPNQRKNLWSQNMLTRWGKSSWDQRASFAQSLLNRFQQEDGQKNDLWGQRAEHAQNFLDRYNQYQPQPIPGQTNPMLNPYQAQPPPTFGAKPDELPPWVMSSPMFMR